MTVGWGAVPEDQVKTLIDMPAGEAGAWIRRHVDPAWGLSGKTVFTVTLRRDVTRTQEAQLKIAATDAEAAKRIARGMLARDEDLTWDDVGDADIDTPMIFCREERQ